MSLSDNPLPTARNHRIDLLKGLALGMIFIDHLEDAAHVSLISRWTLRAWGPSDAAELFVLLSGLVIGRSYSSRLSRASFWSTQQHALWQTVRIYLAYALTAGLLLCLAEWLRMPGSMRLAGMSQSTHDLLLDLGPTLSLHASPPVLHILVLYLGLILLSPSLVRLGRSSLPALLLLASAVYVFHHWGRLSPTSVDGSAGSGWYFQWGGWQMLYCLGIVGGITWQKRGLPGYESRQSSPAIRRPIVLSLMIGVVVAGYWLRPDLPGNVNSFIHDLPIEIRNGLLRLADKRSLGPARLAHAVAVCVLLLVTVPSAWSHSMPAAWNHVRRCGQFSLLTYCVGTILAYIGAWFLDRFGREPAIALLVAIDGLALLAAVAVWRLTLANRSVLKHAETSSSSGSQSTRGHHGKLQGDD